MSALARVRKSRTPSVVRSTGSPVQTATARAASRASRDRISVSATTPTKLPSTTTATTPGSAETAAASKPDSSAPR